MSKCPLYLLFTVVEKCNQSIVLVAHKTIQTLYRLKPSVTAAAFVQQLSGSQSMINSYQLARMIPNGLTNAIRAVRGKLCTVLTSAVNAAVVLCDYRPAQLDLFPVASY